ncbi:MAG: alpha-mannosidase [Firmicutes bacterium]|nr:alpha-mannosidase [Bacillota bacterium]
MFFAVEKFQRRAQEMAQRRYVDMIPISPMTAMDDPLDGDTVHTEAPAKVEGRPYVQGDAFIGRDRYLWIEKTLTLPPAREGFDVVGRFDFGETGGGFCRAFESLLYVNGTRYQGVDTYHNDVVLQDYAGLETRLTFLLWTGLEGGGEPRTFRHEYRQAEVGYLHKAADEMYYFTRAIAGTLPLMSESDPMRYRLEEALDRALALINWDKDRYLDTVGAALARLMEEFDRIGSKTDLTAYVVGHSHIDVAWLWRLKHTREKAQRTFSTVLRYMEEFDEYVFMHSSPQVYKDLKTDAPELYERIKQRVAEGRWEPEGGMWLEADCNLTSGESLARQLEHGIRFFREEFGKPSTYLWLPDVFGYSWALPQILKLTNIKTFVTTKISWNQFNSMPNDIFKWRGLDGSEVLTYFIDVPGSEQEIPMRFSTYNGNISPASVLGSWTKQRNKDISTNYLIAYGHGDGGGGVDHDMLKMRRAMDKIPGIPHVKSARAGEFLDQLHQDIVSWEDKPLKEVPVWDGELYLEYHRGTYTSQAHNKLNNRLSEFALSQAEWLSSLAYVLGGPYDRKALYDNWETVLELQFHDIIPGSSIREVYEDSDRMYQQVLENTEAITRQALSRLVKKEDDTYTVYNFSGFPRTSQVFVPVNTGDGSLCSAEDQSEGRLSDPNDLAAEEASYQFRLVTGKALNAQKTEGGYLVEVPAKPLSLTSFIAEKTEANTENRPLCKFDGKHVSTPHYELTFNEQNFICRLYDKDLDREVLSGLGNALEIFEDKPINYDNWDIDIFYTQKKEYLTPAGPILLKENGPLGMVLELAFTYGHSVLTQQIILHNNSRRIDFVTHVDWHEDHRLLKTAFETSLRTTKATYDIQYGHVERPTHFNNSWDYARFEVVGHKWGDLSEQNYGVALLNNCKYGYNAKDGTIKLSLLKSSKQPDIQADMGEHDFTYSLLPHAGGPIDGGVIQEADFLNLPYHLVSGISPVAGLDLFRIEGEGIHVDAIKKAEDTGDLVLRFHECFGGTQKIRITSDFQIKSFTEANLLEQPIGETIEASEISRTVKPFEIVNYLVKIR